MRAPVAYGEAVSHPSRVDDWEQHWRAFGAAASDNPAQAYRRALIDALIARGPRPRRILDLGCGQGDLLAALDAGWPEAELSGVDLSAEGLRQAATKVPRAHLVQADLLRDDPTATPLAAWADVAVCSEVLEHLEDPGAFLATAARCVAAGGRLIVTVPGGPRTAFDRHIGHRRHFRTASLAALLRSAEFDVEYVAGVGFPFFNLYKLAVLLRGEGLARAVSSEAVPSPAARVAMQLFGRLLRPSRNAWRGGWQLIAVARRKRTEVGPCTI
jgi:SAM-dependent methyltransferase